MDVLSIMDLPPPPPRVPPSRGHPRPRVLAAIAAGAILAGLLLGVLVRMIPGPATPSPIAVLPTVRPSVPASGPTGSEASPPPATSTPAAPSDASSPDNGTTARFEPVRGSGLEIGWSILMAAGPDGGLYVAIPRQRDEVVMLLGRDGRPRSGWPIVLTAPGDCYTLLAVADGSVRIVCHRAALDDGLGGAIGRAFAFDAQGRAMPGWPVDVEDFFDASMVGSDLVALARPYAGDTLEQGSPELVRMVVVAADGAVRTGADVSFACCDNDFAIGPGAIGVVSTRDWHDEGTSVTTRLVAFDEGGPRDGWPVTLDGNASEVAFDPRGAIQLVVSPPYRPPSRTVVLGPDGRSLPGGSGDLAIVPTGTWNGAGDPWPGAPIVAFDGTAFIASTEEGGPTTILALDPGGRPIAGWPYRSKRGVQYINTCGEADTGCGSLRTLLSAGPGNRLYLFAEAASSSTGGSMVAIGPDGRVIDGWPVTLRRAGSMFWSMAVSPDGGVWALAIEPEERDFSATILAVDDDSTVRSATTVVEP